MTALCLLRWKANDEPVLIGQAFDLSNFGFFQRASVREMIVFVCRTIVRRTHPGQRQTVQNEDYFCHVHVKDNQIAAIAVADEEYPSRAAFSVLSQILDDYEKQVLHTFILNTFSHLMSPDYWNNKRSCRWSTGWRCG